MEFHVLGYEDQHRTASCLEDILPHDIVSESSDMAIIYNDIGILGTMDFEIT